MSFRTSARTLRQAATTVLLLSAAAALSPAAAAVVSGASSAFGESVALSTTSPIPLVPTVVASSGPLPSASGVAPAPYSVTQSALSAFVLDVLSTGVLTTTASSTIDGLPGFRTATAGSTVNDLVVGILGVIGLTADTVSSTAQVGGTPGSIAAFGSTSIANLRLNGLSVSTTALAPNTVVLNTGGVRVTLNEQVATGSGNAQGLQVNAISIALNSASQPIVGDLLGRVNTVSGTILIGHSEATLSATADVPEPASLALLGAGVLGLGAARRRAKGG